MVAGRYMLRAPLGRGGMGMVWRAYDTVLGRPVAIKKVQLAPALSATERRSLQASVMREARAAARLNHPGAVTVYDVISDQGQTFIVMELVKAPTLADLIRERGPLAPRRVAEIGAQLAAALAAAHRVGIVHRDVKPGNVMVPEDGGVKLADFGIASVQGDPRLTVTGLVLGSAHYMAPEQASGEPSGPPADVWTLGATMYAAVEGEPPFDKGALIPTLAAVVNEEPRPMRRAGPLAPVIAALLAKDPGARPSAATVRAWLDMLVEEALPASPTEVLPTRGPAGTIPLPPQPPTPPPSSPEPAATPPPTPAATPPAATSVPLPTPPAGSAGELPAGPPPVARPSRPLLPPAPPVRRRRGARLLGVLALLLTVGLLVAWLAAGIGARPGQNRAAPATTRAGTGATRTTQPAPSATGEPTTTREPTTTLAPPTTATAPQAGLPAGWRAFTNRAGNHRVGVPPGFQARTRPTYHATVVEEQRDPGRVFTVRSTTPANPLPQASRDYRAWARRNFAGFREVRYAEQQTYAGHPGAVVFEYEAVRDGRRVHVSHVNLKAGTWGYNVELITPADQWARSQPLARQFEQAFQPFG
jgi:eukaryotic-like serine/threonine-protein kinase